MRKRKDIDTSTVGGRIQSLRSKLHLTQEELARKLNISDRSIISMYETNRREVPWSLAVEIAKVLESSPYYILGGTDRDDSFISEVEVEAYSVKTEDYKKAILGLLKVLVDLERKSLDGELM